MSSFRKVRKKSGCCPFCATPLPDDGTIVYSEGNGFLSRWGVSIYLPPIVNKIFRALMRAYPNAVERPDLEVAGWGYDAEVGEKHLHIHIHHMRKMLKLLGLSVLNHHGAGYYLIKNPSPPKGLIKTSYSASQHYGNGAERRIIRAITNGEN